MNHEFCPTGVRVRGSGVRRREGWRSGQGLMVEDPGARGGDPRRQWGISVRSVLEGRPEGEQQRRGDWLGGCF